jgi:alanine racemase
MHWTRRKFLKFSGVPLLTFFGSFKREPRFPSPSPRKSVRSVRHDAWIELKLDHLGWNLGKIRERVKRPVMAVIKANAYGHGLIPTARYLNDLDIASLMVCKLDEAIQLREAGVSCPILNFGPFFPESAELLIRYDISQSVFTNDIRVLDSTAQNMAKRAKVHIHIDTGMGRMGIPHHEAYPLISELPSLVNLDVQGISTTLTEDEEFDREQIKRLISLCQRAEKSGIALGKKHAASSAAILSYPDSYLDMVRPGILIYGYYPSENTQQEDTLALKGVLQLKCRVAAVKTLRPGDSIAYHRAYVAKKKEKIAVLSIGYSDGYPFNITGHGDVLLNGERASIVGAITANHLEVRLKSHSTVSMGDEAVLIGQQGGETISAHEVSQWAGVSTYKILIGLNPLLPRISV